MGRHAGADIDSPAPEVAILHPGDFKGPQAQTAILTLRPQDGREKRLEYETGPASMAVIWYFKYWASRFSGFDCRTGSGSPLRPVPFC